MVKSYRITAPLLSDEERAQAVQPGGLSGEESSDTMRGMLVGLQHLSHVYPGTADPARVAKRRARNKAARQSRKTNR
jgi:hypothetical protein